MGGSAVHYPCWSAKEIHVCWIVLMIIFPVKLPLNMNKAYFFMKMLLIYYNTIPYDRAQLLW